jgi:hypothetical protein
MRTLTRSAGAQAAAMVVLLILPPATAIAHDPISTTIHSASASDTAPVGSTAFVGAPDLLQLSYSPDTIKLTPGKVSFWDLRLRVLEEQTETLTMSLGGPPRSGERFREDLLVSASACSHPFTERGCEATETLITSVIPFDKVSGTANITVRAKDDLNDAVYVRVKMAYAADADALRAPVQVVFAATAVGTPATETTPDLPVGAVPPGMLPNTGTALLPYLNLGAGAVILGLLISNLARRGRVTGDR